MKETGIYASVGLQWESPNAADWTCIPSLYYNGKIQTYQVRDRAWFVRLYGEIIPSFSVGIIDRTGAQTMLNLTCTTITSVDLAHYGVSRAKDWVSVDYGTISYNGTFLFWTL